MTSQFALVDCNNFYASCERLFNPKLEGKPVVVLSNNDGCAIARSNEAKALGIKMGDPYFQIKELVEKHQVQVFSSNYELYGDMSSRVISTLRGFSPNVEVYSIDESFLDLGGFKSLDVPAYAREIRQAVKQYNGIPACVGVAPTKTLAKVANRMAKKSAKAQGSLVLTDPYHIDEALKRTQIGDVWGVGRQYDRLLQLAGKTTAYDLKHAADAWVKKHMSIVMLRTVRKLRGEPCADLEIQPPAKKGISTSRSFAKTVTKFDDVLEATATLHAARCAAKLRKQRSCTKAVTVFVETNRYSNGAQYHNSRRIILPTASNSTLELVKYAKIALENLFIPGYEYKKCGVIVTEIMPEHNVQLNLLDTTDHAKHQTLMQFLDDITQWYGKDAVKVACQGTAKKKDWHMQREHVSPCYTTRFSDILTVKI